MTTLDSRRVLGDGLTKAAEALAAGSDELRLHDAALHLAHALGASKVAIVSMRGEPHELQVVADSDDRRSAPETAALLDAAAIREALASREVVVTSRPAAAGGPVDDVWAVFPIIAGHRARGILLAVFEASRAEEGVLPQDIILCGTAAAALVAVALPSGQTAERPAERTRRVTLTDVHRERRLRAIERYRAFIDSASDGIVVIDGAATVLYMNHAAEQVTGYARQGLEGKSLTQIVPEPQHFMLEQMVALAVKSRPVENFDLEIITTSQDQITVSVASIGILSEYGAAIFAFRDVTLARGLEVELRRTSEFLERILNSAVDGIIAADLKGMVILFNSGAERICGYHASDVIGKMPVTDLYPPRVAQEIMRLLRSSQRGGEGRLEPVRRELKAASGELIPVSISAALVFDDAGREIATVGIFSDLRERLRMEERLAKAQEKLAVSEKQTVAIELAGAAAHELNQPLTSIMGYAQMLLRKLEPESPQQRALETILSESERMAGIVRQLGSLTRYETKSYVGGAQIIDLGRSSGQVGTDE
ncbi:MAG TPA: PAS domain S-box protein [Polyangia bacterium]|jgi:PAS domain S-box-containing protein